MTKLIDPNEIDFAATIKSLNPFAIDLSNVPDYLEKESFIKFARACSVEDTVHTLHFMNWPQYVFGACHIDWVNCQDDCQKLYREMKRGDMEKERSWQALRSDKKSIFSFLEYNPYGNNNLDEKDMFLTIQFRNIFEDFFLSDEQGNVLQRFKNSMCDSAVSSFFDRSNTMIRSAFTFNNDIELGLEDC